MKYRHVLVATELLTEQPDAACLRAKELADDQGADLKVLHVVDELARYAAGVGNAMGIADIEKELYLDAEKKMAAVVETIGLNNDDAILEIGYPRRVILEQAERVKADLIIVGAHDKHGLGLLHGTTADTVLHRAHCDVLTVRLFD